MKHVFEMMQMMQIDANFLNLRIDKATKTRGDKQLFNHTFYETNFKPKLFTANVECNGTVIKMALTLEMHTSPRNSAEHTLFLFASFRRSKSALCHLLCEATCSLRTDKQLGNNVTSVDE